MMKHAGDDCARKILCTTYILLLYRNTGDVPHVTYLICTSVARHRRIVPIAHVLSVHALCHLKFHVHLPLLCRSDYIRLIPVLLTGFGAFVASGLAVYNQWQLVIGPVAPGVLLLVAGFYFIVRRIQSIHPGWAAVWNAMKPGKKRLRQVHDDIEMGQAAFWRHCRHELGKRAHGRLAGFPVELPSRVPQLAAVEERQGLLSTPA